LHNKSFAIILGRGILFYKISLFEKVIEKPQAPVRANSLKLG